MGNWSKLRKEYDHSLRHRIDAYSLQYVILQERKHCSVSYQQQQQQKNFGKFYTKKLQLFVKFCTKKKCHKTNPKHLIFIFNGSTVLNYSRTNKYEVYYSFISLDS